MPTRRRVVPTLFGAAMLATAGIGLAFAQDNGAVQPSLPQDPEVEAPPVTGGEPPSAPSPVGEAPPGPSMGESEAPVSVTTNLSAGEQTSEAQGILARGGTLSTRVSQMLDEARRDRDIIRITCLNDKLTQINANITSVDERVQALQAAHNINNRDQANHEYTVITVLGQKFRILEQDANTCVGGEVFDTDGSTTIETRVNPGTPVGEVPEQIGNPVPPTAPYVPPVMSGGITP